ncbi:hypothetical protein ACJX0J_007484, partial [Zea mays]
ILFLHLISTSTAYWDNEKRIEGVLNPIKKPILVLNASPPLEFTGYPFFLSMGLHPDLWNIVHSSSYCLFTYYLCKNTQNEKGIKENKKSNFLQDLAKLLMQNDQLKKRVDTTIRLLNQLTTIKAAQVRLTISIILLLLINNHSGIKGTDSNDHSEFTPNKFLYDFYRNMIHRDALNRRRGNREIFSFICYLFYKQMTKEMYECMYLINTIILSILLIRKEQVFIHIFLLITKTFFFFYLESNSTYFFRIFFKKLISAFFI